MFEWVESIKLFDDTGKQIFASGSESIDTFLCRPSELFMELPDGSVFANEQYVSQLSYIENLARDKQYESNPRASRYWAKMFSNGTGGHFPFWIFIRCHTDSRQEYGSDVFNKNIESFEAVCSAVGREPTLTRGKFKVLSRSHSSGLMFRPGLQTIVSSLYITGFCSLEVLTTIQGRHVCIGTIDNSSIVVPSEATKQSNEYSLIKEDFEDLFSLWLRTTRYAKVMYTYLYFRNIDINVGLYKTFTMSNIESILQSVFWRTVIDIRNMFLDDHNKSSITFLRIVRNLKSLMKLDLPAEYKRQVQELLKILPKDKPSARKLFSHFTQSRGILGSYREGPTLDRIRNEQAAHSDTGTFKSVAGIGDFYGLKEDTIEEHAKEIFSLLRLAAYYLLEIRERVFGKDNVRWEAQGQLTIDVDACFDEGVAWQYFDSLPIDKFKFGI